MCRIDGEGEDARKDGAGEGVESVGGGFGWLNRCCMYVGNFVEEEIDIRIYRGIQDYPASMLRQILYSKGLRSKLHWQLHK